MTVRVHAQERWRRFNGHELVADALDGTRFKDGIRVTEDDTNDPDDGRERSPSERFHAPHPQHLTTALILAVGRAPRTRAYVGDLKLVCRARSLLEVRRGMTVGQTELPDNGCKT